MNRSLSMTVAASLALAGLAVALVAGMMGDGHLVTILERALLACGLSFILGLVVGTLLEGVIRRHAQELLDQASQMEPPELSALDSSEDGSDGHSSATVGEQVSAV